MTNEDYIKAHALIPSQNALLKTNDDYYLYDILCDNLITTKRFCITLARYANKNPIRQMLLKWIIQKTPLLNQVAFDVKIATRIYWIINGLTNFPKCARKECNNLIGINKNAVSILKGYNKHCCVSCINRDQVTRQKISTTKTNLYGDPAFNNRPKNNKTCQQKYGTTNGGGTYMAHKKMHRKYFYQNMYFDSAPEIAYYIWLKDNDVQFEYQPKIPLQYEFNNKTCNYFVDFLVNGTQLIEIKGDQFFNENGILFCPYRNKKWTDEQYAKINERYAAKHQCMLDNNVKIMKYADYKPYLDYIVQTYGKDYLKQFRVNKAKRT